jgi:hypothetical protein
MLTAVMSEQNVELLWFHDNADLLANKLQIEFNEVLLHLLPYNREKNQFCLPFIDEVLEDELHGRELHKDPYNELLTYDWTDQKVKKFKDNEIKDPNDKKDQTFKEKDQTFKDRYEENDKCKFKKEAQDEYNMNYEIFDREIENVKNKVLILFIKRFISDTKDYK